MARFTLPRDIYHGKGSLEALKTLQGKKAIICVGGGSMKRNGFLQRAEDYLKEAGMEVKLFEGIVDVYLPDFKYLDPEHAKKYSGAEDYPEVAKAALEEMVWQTGNPVFNDAGIMTKGVIVRHLLLPGCLRDARRIVKYLYETYGDQIYMSLMNQYTPLDTLNREKYPELAKKVTKKAYDVLVDYAIDLGVEQAFIQEGETAKESFIPDFPYEGV